jgi:hypothetical protein
MQHAIDRIPTIRFLLITILADFSAAAAASTDLPPRSAAV